MLYNPRLKLCRAEEHFNSLKSAIVDFIKLKPYSFFVKANPKPPDFLVIAKLNQAIPDKLGLIIGDFANNARAALDLIIYPLCQLPPDDRGRHHIKFPICDKPELYAGEAKKALKSIDPKYVTMVECLQPYKGAYGSDQDPLLILKDINNADKHRVITVVVAVAQFKNMVFGPGDYGGLRVGGNMILSYGSRTTTRLFCFVSVGDGVITENETVVASLVVKHPLKVDMQPQVEISVKFDEGTARVKGRDVIPTLTLIRDRVEEVIRKFETILHK